MNNRVRWYTIRPLRRADLEKIQQQMRSDEFTTQRGWGFQVESASRESFKARYVEQSEVTDTVVDPFGNQLQFKRTEYRILGFRISTKVPNLELYNASNRILTPFLNQLNAYLSFEVEIFAPSVDLLQWIKRLEKGATRVTVFSLSVSDLPLSNSVKAQALISGTEDVRRYLPAFAANRKFSLQKGFIEVLLGDEKIRCELCNSSRAVSKRGLSEAELDYLREALRDIVATK